MYSFEIRKKRLEKRIGQVFSEFLLFEVGDQRFQGQFISVTRVELNRELNKVTIFFRLLDQFNKNKTIKLLYHILPFFLSYLRKKITLRKLPEVRFINDQKYQESEQVLRMIDDISKRNKKSHSE